MRILVTGHEGFIGGHIHQTFQAKGMQVDGYEYQEDVFPEVKDYDWVVHCGAISSTTERDIDKVWRQNHDFTRRLITACCAHGTHLQYASSASVYGPYQHFKETDPCLPQSPYAWSKFLIDKYLIDQGWSQFPIIIQGFRYFNVYGDGEAHKKDQRSPVSKFADQAQQTGEIRLFEGSDDFLRDFVCVQDVVAVHTQMLQKPVSGIFNVGTGTARSFASIAESIAQAHQAKVTCIPMPEKLKGQYQTYTCADLTALNSVIAKTEWLSPDDYLQGKHLVMAEAD